MTEPRLTDPTALTSKQIITGDVTERVYVDGQIGIIAARLDGIESTVRERLRGMDVANQILSATVNRVPTDLQTAIQNMDRIQTVRFEAVDQQFKERDVRAERESRDNKIAVDAAITAQKESANKTEANFAKLVDSITIQINAQGVALGDKIDNVKERVGLSEGKGLGSTAAIVMGISLLVAIASVIGVVLALTK